MLRLKRCLCLLLSAGVLGGLLSARAELAADDAFFAENTWDQITQAFLQDWGADPDKVAVGYRNTVTGEEHFLQGDTYLPAASMYKVALNMYWAEKIYLGEETWDMPVSGLPYSLVQQRSLIDSNNELSYALRDLIGSYTEYRRATARFYGLSQDTQDEAYLESECLTPRQVLHCLQMLLDDPDRYPGVLDCLLQAEPDEYFRRDEDRYLIAQKYGYLDSPRRINSCAIVYTDEPFLLVVFTVSLYHGEQFLSDYCTLMCDYTQIRMEQRQEKEAAARARAALLPGGQERLLRPQEELPVCRPAGDARRARPLRRLRGRAARRRRPGRPPLPPPR